MTSDRLSTIFAALADPTRRAILARLISGEATVTRLAEPFRMSMPEPERLVFTSNALDKGGKAMFENLNTVIFSAQEGKTAVALSVKVLRSSAGALQHLAGMEMGWKLTLDRLGEYLKTMGLTQK